MRKYGTAFQSSSSSEEKDEFYDQGILDFGGNNTSIFDDDDIQLLKSSGAFPSGARFRFYDPDLKADQASSKWMCFPEYPFTPAPKFERLIPSGSDSEKKIAALLKIDKEDRSFCVTPIFFESSVNSEHSLAAMSLVKKEKPSPASIKPRALPLRSSTKASKQRKTGETTEPESFEGSSPIDIIQKSEVLFQLGMEKLSAEKDTFDKQIGELEDLKKIADGKAKFLEKENVKLKKQMKDLDAAQTHRVKETIEGAKKSAAIAILQFNIKMAREAADNGLTIWDKNLR